MKFLRLAKRGGVAWVLAAVCLGLVVGCGKAKKPPRQERAGAVPVKVVKPRMDRNFKMTISQPCYVDPYYHVNVEARVAGPVVYLQKDIGDEVKKGDKLIEISVPDLALEVIKKTAIVEQRKRELKVARALVKKADVDVRIAEAEARVKEADVETADATTAFRKTEFERYRDLARQDRAVTEIIVAEREMYYRAAAAAGRGARAAVDRAKADIVGAKAKLEEAKADEELKESLVDVAGKDVEVSQAMLSFATLRAETDGTITSRNIDLGGFAQNSTAGTPRPLLTIDRTDIVTVYTKLPDNYAPYIEPGTEVQIEMTELPGMKLLAKVTRTSGSLQTPTNDRTLRVEVDLYNRDEESYRKAKEEWDRTGRAALKSGTEPSLPKEKGKDVQRRALLPGMYGTMRLVLQKFAHTYLLPSEAVFTKGGTPYIFIVHGEVANLVPVEVQVDDGVKAKVVVIDPGSQGGRRDLTGDEEIVLSKQGELSDGQPVKPSLVPW
jgi:multidrug resistance efflux pump